MLRNYNSFLLLESKKRDTKLDKQKQKINKFLTFEPIIDYVFELTCNKHFYYDSPQGYQANYFILGKSWKRYI